MNERVTRASRVPNFLPPLIKTLSNNSSSGSKSHVSSHEPSTPPTEDSRRHAPTQDLTPPRARRRHKTTTSTPSTRVSRTKRADWISLASNRAIERRKPKSRRVTRRVERAISIAPAGFVCAAATHRATHSFSRTRVEFSGLRTGKRGRRRGVDVRRGCSRTRDRGRRTKGSRGG